MTTYCLRRRQELPADLDRAWRFFSDPNNLRMITPSWLDFTMTATAPETIYPGLILSYRIRPLAGLPVAWISEITHVDAPYYFVDEQRSGPYRFWHHQHHLTAVENGVTVEDIIHYRLPFGYLGVILHGIWVQSRLDEIFRFRYHALARHFR